jgi:hypothetical protein
VKQFTQITVHIHMKRTSINRIGPAATETLISHRA